MARRVLVTGGAGRIAQIVLGLLDERGYDTIGLDRIPAPSGSPVKEHFVGDLSDYAAVYAAAQGVDAVIHLGAVPHDNGDDIGLMQGNTVGTVNVLHACETLEISRCVIASSICAIGHVYQRARETSPVALDYLPLDEEHPLRPNDPYRMSKVVGELYGKAYSERGGMSVLCLRPTCVLYDATGDGARPSFATSIDNGCVAGIDCARAFVTALDADVKFGVYLISSRYRYTDTGETETPDEQRRLAEEAGIADLRKVGGFLESGGSSVSIQAAIRDLGYDPIL